MRPLQGVGGRRQHGMCFYRFTGTWEDPRMNDTCQELSGKSLATTKDAHVDD